MQKKYFKAWRAGVGTKQENEPLIAAEAPTVKESPDSSKDIEHAKKEVSFHFLTVWLHPASCLFVGGK